MSKQKQFWMIDWFGRINSFWNRNLHASENWRDEKRNRNLQVSEIKQHTLGAIWGRAQGIVQSVNFVQDSDQCSLNLIGLSKSNTFPQISERISKMIYCSEGTVCSETTAKCSMGCDLLLFPKRCDFYFGFFCCWKIIVLLIFWKIIFLKNDTSFWKQ